MDEGGVINTEVDAIVRALSRRRRLELGELAKEANMSKSRAEYWSKLLSEEGFVRLEKGLFRTYVVWTGSLLDSFSDAELMESTSMRSKPIQEDHTKETASSVELKKEAIVEKFKESSEVSEDQSVSDGVVDVVEISEELEPSFDAGDVDNSESSNPESRSFSFEISAPTELSNSLRELVEEIERKKSEIDKLKAEKRIWARKRLLPLDSKVNAGISAFIDALLEKEQELLRLRNLAINLPETEGQIEEILSKLRDAVSDAENSLKSAKEVASQFSSEIDSVKSDLEESLARASDLYDEEMKRISSLEGAISEIEEREFELKERQERIADEISRLSEEMERINEELGAAASARLDLFRAVSASKKLMEKKFSESSRLKSEIERLENARNRSLEYLSAFEERVSMLKDYLEKGESDLERLRKSAVSKGVERYLSSLESLMADYEREISIARDEEDSLDRKIAESQAELMDLMSRTRELMSSIKRKMDKYVDFEKAFEEVVGNASSLRELVSSVPSPEAKPIQSKSIEPIVAGPAKTEKKARKKSSKKRATSRKKTASKTPAKKKRSSKSSGKKSSAKKKKSSGNKK